MSGLLGKRKSFPRWDSNPVPSEPYSRHCIDKGGVVQKKKKKKKKREEEEDEEEKKKEEEEEEEEENKKTKKKQKKYKKKKFFHGHYLSAPPSNSSLFIRVSLYRNQENVLGEFLYVFASVSGAFAWPKITG